MNPNINKHNTLYWGSVLSRLRMKKKTQDENSSQNNIKKGDQAGVFSPHNGPHRSFSPPVLDLLY